MSFVNLNRARISRRILAQGDERGRARAGLLIGGIAALVFATQPPFATSDDSPANKAEQARAKATADDLPDDVKRQRLGLQEIARGYKANREAFAFVKCRVKTLGNRAETVHDALAGKWKNPQPEYSREVTMWFRDDALVYKPEIKQQNFVRKGRFAFRQDGNVVIFSPPIVDNDHLHPFDWIMEPVGQHFDPAAVMAQAESGNYEGIRLELQENVVQDGKELVLFRHRDLPRHPYDVDFEIDRRRGYLPITTDYFLRRSEKRPSLQLHMRRFVLDTHREGTAYFPTHVMHVVLSETRQGDRHVSVSEQRVLDLDLARPPSAEDMTVELPKMAKFRIALNPGPDKTLFADAEGDTVTVSVDDIEKIYRQLEAAGAEKKPPATTDLLEDVQKDPLILKRRVIVHRSMRKPTLTGIRVVIPGADEIEEELWQRITRLPRVVELTISTRHVGNREMQQIASLADLEVLYLEPSTYVDAGGGQTTLVGKTKITAKEGFAELKRLEHLQRLQLTWADIDEAILFQIAAIDSLEELDLSQTELPPAALSCLENLKRLSNLNLGYTATDNEALKAIARIDSLESLVLTKTRVTDAGLAALQRLKKLQFLRLDGVAFSAEGMESITQIQSLRSLYLGHRHLTGEEVAMLMKLRGLQALVAGVPHPSVLQKHPALVRYSDGLNSRFVRKLTTAGEPFEYVKPTDGK